MTAAPQPTSAPQPTPVQADLIGYLDGEILALGAHFVPQTYAACRRHGWIEPDPTGPFHRPTLAGRIARGVDTRTVTPAEYRRALNMAHVENTRRAASPQPAPTGR